MYKATIIGTGRSGRGMLGELFSHEQNYQVTFADIDGDLVEGLNIQGFYHVTMTNLKTSQSKTNRVEKVQVIDAAKQTKEYIENLAQADIILTALMPEAFDHVIEHLVKAMRLRMKRGVTAAMRITLGANYVGLYEYYDRGFRSLLTPDETEYYQKHVCLIMSIVNRKNLLPTDRQRLDPYHIVGDDKSVLRVEALPEICDWEGCPSFFKPETNLSAAMATKIWAGNLVQCSMAFVALHYGLEDSYQAAHHPLASKYAYYASQEGYFGVSREYGLPPRSPEASRYTVSVFRNEKFKDNLHRIAREPIRKMGRRDRFIGPALLCIKYGKLPYYIALCCAHGFFYYNDTDEQCRKMKEDIEKKGISSVVEEYCQLDIAKDDEKLLFELIVSAYNSISDYNPLNVAD